MGVGQTYRVILRSVGTLILPQQKPDRRAGSLPFSIQFIVKADICNHAVPAQGFYFRFGNTVAFKLIKILQINSLFFSHVLFPPVI